MVMVVTGFGTAIPAGRISQAAAYESTHAFCCDSDEQRRVMELIFQGSGVAERGTVVLDEHIHSKYVSTDFFKPPKNADDRGPTTKARMEQYQTNALDLALASCRKALADAGQDVAEITHLVTVSCSGFHAPGFDIGLIEELGLPRDTSRTHVGFMGCHGSFNALRVAKAYVDADPNAVVLVCSVEICSVHWFYGWSIEKVIANALFADGSGAVVCRRRPENGEVNCEKYRLISNGSFVMPDTADAMTWRIGDHGFEMTLSQRVPSLIQKHLRSWMEPFLAKQGLTLEDVRGWAIHPGGPKILDACLSALSLENLTVSAAREVLSRYGNMSSATILFLLERLKQEPLEGPVVALGFGPGLTIEAMLLSSPG